MKIRTLANLYCLGWLPVMLWVGPMLNQEVGWWATVLALFLYLVPTLKMECPRCGLPLSYRDHYNRAGVHYRGVYAPNPRRCSRCKLDFRVHRFGDRFPELP